MLLSLIESSLNATTSQKEGGAFDHHVCGASSPITSEIRHHLKQIHHYFATSYPQFFLLQGHLFMGQTRKCVLNLKNEESS